MKQLTLDFQAENTVAEESHLLQNSSESRIHFYDHYERFVKHFHDVSMSKFL